MCKKQDDHDNRHGCSGNCNCGQVNEFAPEATDNYKTHRAAMSEMSIADVKRVVDYAVELSHYLNDDSPILDEMDDVLAPFYELLNKLETGRVCNRHEGYTPSLYMSDLPQYNFVCPDCNENY